MDKTRIRKVVCVNTFELVEETWIDKRKDGEKNTHEEEEARMAYSLLVMLLLLIMIVVVSVYKTNPY